MAAYLDSVPMSGIIRIRDMMFQVTSPFRLDQGDVSFDAPDTVKAAMTRAIAENRTHYVQTAGLPRLRELLSASGLSLGGASVHGGSAGQNGGGPAPRVVVPAYTPFAGANDEFEPRPAAARATGRIDLFA